MRIQSLSYPKAMLMAVLLHVCMLSVIFFKPVTSPPPQTTTIKAAPEMIKATSIDEQAVMAQVASLRQKRRDEHLREQKLKKTLQRQKELIQKADRNLRQMNQQIRQKAKEVTQQRLALDKIKQQKKHEKAQAQAAARKRMQLIAAAKRAKAEAELSKIRAVSPASQGQIDRFAVLIKQAISRQWIVPSSVPKSSYCRLQVRVAPSGDVLDVVVLQGSGNTVLDRAAKQAIYKASPLPVPSEKIVFSKFKTFNITMRPEKILTALPGVQ